jgi:MFS family permease
MQVYHIPPKTMGYILSGWNWSYTSGILVMGPLVDRFGAWIVTGAGSVVWGLSTVALPLAGDPSSLFLMRLLFGLGHSVLLAATAASISREFGGKERARAVAVAYSGNQVGLAAGATVAAFILVQVGWKAVFYWIGGTSLLFTVAWFVFYPDKRIGTSAVQPGPARTDGARPWNSWLAFLNLRSTWGIALGQMGYLYALGVFVSWLPGYLVLERKMTLLKSGLVSALPFWAGILATLAGGWLGDHLIKRGVSTTRSRKSIIGTGLIAATLFVSFAAVAQQAWLSVALITLCVCCLRMTTGSVNALPIDLALGSGVGALSSIQNFFGNIGAVSAPIVTGYLVSSTGSFTTALVVAGAMAAFGAAAYLFILGDLEPN